LGTNPPAVIQLQIDGTGNGERSGLDVHSDDEKQLKHKRVVMTRNPVTHRTMEGVQHLPVAVMRRT
jgi:hypothetical protein